MKKFIKQLSFKNLRKATKLTQQEIAERYSLNRTTISNYERGAWRPLPLLVRALEDYIELIKLRNTKKQ
jgi:transcriptional regulator with XRE-family HTH domain